MGCVFKGRYACDPEEAVDSEGRWRLSGDGEAFGEPCSVFGVCVFGGEPVRTVYWRSTW